MKKGFSLLEVLVVLALFSVLAIVASQSLILTLQGAKKSESTARVRQSLDFAVAIIERQLRNAKGVTCPNPDPKILTYTDSLGATSTFSCVINSTDQYLASASARLTEEEVAVTECAFTCTTDPAGKSPPSVRLTLTARKKDGETLDSSRVTLTSEVLLRTY